MIAPTRTQRHRSKLAQSGSKRIELTLTPEEQKLLGPRPAQALKAWINHWIKAELHVEKYRESNAWFAERGFVDIRAMLEKELEK